MSCKNHFTYLCFFYTLCSTGIPTVCCFRFVVIIVFEQGSDTETLLLFNSDNEVYRWYTVRIIKHCEINVRRTTRTSSKFNIGSVLNSHQVGKGTVNRPYHSFDPTVPNMGLTHTDIDMLVREGGDFGGYMVVA